MIQMLKLPDKDFIFFNNKVYSFIMRERERERENTHKQGRGRERETQKPKQSPGSDLSAQSPVRDSSSRTMRS